jgi:hypothetical protein
MGWREPRNELERRRDAEGESRACPERSSPLRAPSHLFGDTPHGFGFELLYVEAFGIGLLVLTTAVFICKIRVEEKLISQQFPSQYVEYRRNVKALVPLLL